MQFGPFGPTMRLPLQRPGLFYQFSLKNMFAGPDLVDAVIERIIGDLLIVWSSIMFDEGQNLTWN